MGTWSGRVPVLLALLVGLSVSPLRAAEAGNELVQPTLLADVQSIAPGSNFTLGLRMKIAPHWHTYWINPGESGEPTKIKLTGPKGLSFGEIRWPVPTKIVMDGAITYGYENEVLLTVPVTVAKDLPASGDATIDADVSWLSCKETCVEGSAKLSLKLLISGKAEPANQELFGRWSKLTPVPATDAAAAAWVSRIEQPAGAGGEAGKSLVVAWKKQPKKVEWFPAATAAVAIEDVQVKPEGNTTRITFSPKVFQADELPGGAVDGVLVLETEDGQRVGVRAPIQVALKK